MGSLIGFLGVLIVPAVSGQIKSHTETLLAGFDVFLIEFVAFFYCAETCILSDSPWPLGIPENGYFSTVVKELENYQIWKQNTWLGMDHECRGPSQEAHVAAYKIIGNSKINYCFDWINI